MDRSANVADLRVFVAGLEFVAQFEAALAPLTCAAFRKLLPLKKIDPLSVERRGSLDSFGSMAASLVYGKSKEPSSPWAGAALCGRPK